MPKVHAVRGAVAIAAAVSATVCHAADSSLSLSPAPAPVWIFLSDKGIQNEESARLAIEQARSALDPSAIRRRSLRGSDSLDVGLQDLPVSSNYARAIAATGADIRVQSRWLNAISVQATPQQLAAIRKLGFVEHIQPVARAKTLAVPEPKGYEQSPDLHAGPQDFYGSASSQLTQINIPAVHNLGFTGTGIKIGILDTGFKRTHQAFNEPGHSINVLAEYDFINNDTNTADTANGQHSHGTNVLGIIGGYKPNTYVGGAYNAQFLLAKTEDVTQEVPAEEDDWVAGLEFLESNGADIVTSSLGYIDWYTQAQLNGNTAVTTLAAKAAAARGLAITNAAGNEGHDSNASTSHLIAPADADLLITVGAVDSSNIAASFTSDGPTADGRVKPEVVARGVDASTVSSGSDTTYASVDGTSFATPLTACAVALIIQAHPDWSVPQIRQALFQTASRAGVFDPQYILGYGLINTLGAVQFSFDKIYTSGVNGTWGTGSNWSGGTIPSSLNNVFIQPATGLTVTGPTVNTSMHNLTVNATSSGQTQLNLASNITFSMDGTFTIGTRGRVNLSNGTLIVTGATVNNGSFNQSGGTASLARVTGTGTMGVAAGARMTADSIQQTALTIGGTVTIRSNGTNTGTSKVTTIALSAGTLDLNNNDLIVASSSYATISGSINNARHGGLWDLPGITSTAARNANPKITTLGVLTGTQFKQAQGAATQFDGFTVVNSDILVKYTYYGDTDFTGKIDGSDYARMDTTYNNEILGGNIGGWFNGDADYNGKVDGADYALIDAAFNAQGQTLLRMLTFLDGTNRNREDMTSPELRMAMLHFDQFGESYVMAALSSVPEPLAAPLLATAAIAFGTRRQRRQ